MLVARQSNHIQEDIKRNWSSWNFGKDGFEGTREELDSYLASATNDEPVYISGFEIYASQIRQFKFGELYANYWVAIDDRGGLSCNVLDFSDVAAAAEFISENPWFCGGDGNFIDCSNAVIVWSKNDLHILEV